MVVIALFELGSLICGVAPNPMALIVGRAIAGLGGAGIGSGAFTIIGFIAEPQKRPALIGFTGATYGIAAVLGLLSVVPSPTRSPGDGASISIYQSVAWLLRLF